MNNNNTQLYFPLITNSSHKSQFNFIRIFYENNLSENINRSSGEKNNIYLNVSVGESSGRTTHYGRYRPFLHCKPSGWMEWGGKLKGGVRRGGGSESRARRVQLMPHQSMYSPTAHDKPDLTQLKSRKRWAWASLSLAYILCKGWSELFSSKNRTNSLICI